MLAGHLAAQLRADRAAGAGDEHGLARDHLGDAGFVQLHRLAAEQVFGFDATHPLDARAAVLQLAGRGHGQHLELGGRGGFDGTAALCRRGAGQGHDHVGGAGTQLRRGHVGECPQHWHATDARAALGRVVVEQAEHDPALLVNSGEQPLGRFTGAQHDGTAHVGVAAGDLRARVFVQHAVGHPHHAQAEE